MASQPISTFFEADNRRLEYLYSNFKNKLGSSKSLTYFWAFKKGIEKNIRWEEDILFPFFEEKMGITHGPVDVMVAEHREILEYLQGIEENLLSDRDVMPVMHALEEVLNMHNNKEEQILFPLIDDCSNDAEKAAFFLIHSTL